VLTILRRSLGNETVTLIVGKTRKAYTVHKQLLCDSSDYFQRAFGGLFKESHEGKMYLEDECEGAVEIFIEWLYRCPIAPAMNLRYLHDLFKLYLMAEKMLLDELADRVMDTILCSFYHQSTYEHLTPEMANYMWGNTKKESPMRTFIVAALGWDYYHLVGCKNREESGGNNVEALGLKALWPICRNHEDFFVAFFSNFRESMIRQPDGRWTWYGGNCDPAAACRDSPDGFCRFHCHEKGYECAAIKDQIGSQDKSKPDWDPEVKSDFFHDLPDEREDLGSCVEALSIS
jgi:hypothetical protein